MIDVGGWPCIIYIIPLIILYILQYRYGLNFGRPLAPLEIIF